LPVGPTFWAKYYLTIITAVSAHTETKSPKEIAGSDITNCLTHTMYAIAFKATQVMQTL